MLKCLFLIDQDDKEIIPKLKSKLWKIHYLVVDYKNIENEIENIRKFIEKNKIDFLVYTKNDEISNTKIGVLNKKLQTGYTYIGGIDKEEHKHQLNVCLNDFLKKSNYSIKMKKIQNNKNEEKTFSLVFDTEQIPCIRFGMPRILKILEKYNIPATFFTTGIIMKLYPNIIEQLEKNGYEIGMHGETHNWFSKYPCKIQENKLISSLNYFKRIPKGANLMGRENQDTFKILSKLGIKYYLFNNVHYFQGLSYKPITRVFKLFNMKMIPANIETYSFTFKEIKGMIDSYINKSNSDHITILMHPFKDGSLKNLERTELLIKYLLSIGYKPIKLEQYAQTLNLNSLQEKTLKEERRRYLPRDVYDLKAILMKVLSYLN